MFLVVCVSRSVVLILVPYRWVLRIPEVSVALVGAKDSEQVRMNAGYHELSAAEIDEIAAILADAPETGIGHLRALPNPRDGLTGAEDA